MAVHKYMGIETEYGLVYNGDALWERDILAALIQVYGQRLKQTGAAYNSSGAGINLYLQNGARFYLDCTHPEYSTPECANPLEVVRHDGAGELIVQNAAEILTNALRARLGNPEVGVEIFKNNTMGSRGMSYGCHENYLIDRKGWAMVRRWLPTHLITRQIFCGAGKVGWDLPEERHSLEERMTVPFQISQRSDFFVEEIGHSTTMHRPIVNTRDEPEAGDHYRRLHVITGDSNRSQTATLLKVGTTALFLAMVEDGWLNDMYSQITPDQPVLSIRQVSHDLSLRQPLTTISGGSITALEIQRILLERAKNYVASVGYDFIGGDQIGNLVLQLWEQTLNQLAVDPMRLVGTLDWPSKKLFIDSALEKRNLDPSSTSAVGLAYKLERLGSTPGRPQGWYGLMQMDEIVPREEVWAALTTPPPDTRAYFRSQVMTRYPTEVDNVSWHQIVFQKEGRFTRIILDEVDEGKEKWESFFATNPSSEQLIDEASRRGLGIFRQNRRPVLDMHLDGLDRTDASREQRRGRLGNRATPSRLGSEPQQRNEPIALGEGE